MKRVADSETPNELARYEAQKLAFAPLFFQAARAMKHLGVLDCLYGGASSGRTAQEIQEATGLSSYAASLLLEAGYASGLCAYEEPRFVITKMGVYWLKDELTRVNAEFAHHVCYRGAFHFESAMREGLPTGLKELGPWPTVYEGLRALPDEIKKAWFAFDHYYSDNVFEEVVPLACAEGVRKLVDVGGNTGKFTKLCVTHHADVDVTIVDLEGQLAVARDNFCDSPHRERVHFVPTNLLDDKARLPEGADVYWLSQFLDCFSEREIVSILRRVRDALPDHGRAYILETYWNKQRHDAARYVVIGTSLYFACIANGNSKMYHSDEMARFVREAGLVIDEERHDIGLSHSLFRCKRA